MRPCFGQHFGKRVMTTSKKAYWQAKCFFFFNHYYFAAESSLMDHSWPTPILWTNGDFREKPMIHLHIQSDTVFVLFGWSMRACLMLFYMYWSLMCSSCKCKSGLVWSWGVKIHSFYSLTVLCSKRFQAHRPIGLCIGWAQLWANNCGLSASVNTSSVDVSLYNLFSLTSFCCKSKVHE